MEQSAANGRPRFRPDLMLSKRRRVADTLALALERSPADETELVWIESRRSRLGLRAPGTDTYRRRQRTVLIRVRERGRSGRYRTGAAGHHEIVDGIRLAMAHATTHPKARLPPMPSAEEPPAPSVEAYDRRVARWTESEALALLAESAQEDEAAIVEWSEGQVAIRNSAGLERYQRATAISLQVRSGLGTGAGFATHAARSLRRLDVDSVFERARRRRTVESSGEPGDPGLFTSATDFGRNTAFGSNNDFANKSDPGRDLGDEGPREDVLGSDRRANHGVPLLLSAEATAELVELLNHRAFAASAFRRGDSFLREHLGVQVFDRRLELKDDGTDPSGLPFPFDLEGRNKFPVALIRGGVPTTPTVDTRSAGDFGVTPTGSSVGGDEAFALNLFLAPGEHSDDQLLELADGGLWISRLDRVECFDPGRVRLRSVARGVRRIHQGRLTQPLPDLLWEDSLLRIFSNFLGIGRNAGCRLSSDGLLGGISAPPVVIGEASEIRPR